MGAEGQLRRARGDDGRRRHRGPTRLAGDPGLRHRHRRPGRQLPGRAAPRRRARGPRADLRPPTAPPEHCPADVVLHRGDLTDLAAVRALLLDVDPHEVYNLAAISSVAQSWSEPDLTARVNGLGAAGLLESALAVQETSGHRGRVRPGVERGDLRRTRHHPAGRVDASRAGQPVRRREGLRPPRRRRLPTSAVCTRAARSSTTTSPLDGPSASSPAGSPRPSPPSPVAAPTASSSATSTPAATGAGPPTTSTPWCAPPEPPTAADYVVATGEGHSVRDFAAAAFARAGIADWEPLLVSDPARLRPADATDLTGDASKARRDLGWAPTVHVRGGRRPHGRRRPRACLDA